MTEDLTNVIKANTEAMREMATALSKMAGDARGGSESLSTLKNKMVDATTQIQKMTGTQQQSSSAFFEQTQRLKDAKTAWEAQQRAVKAVDDEIKKFDKTLDETNDKIGKLEKNLKTVYGALAAGAASVGINGISFIKAKDALLAYNSAMFDVSRSYQQFGKGLGDVSKIFDGISKKTTYSKTEFSSLANTIISGWKGVPPTFEQVGKTVEHLSKQFGYNKEAVKNAIAAMSEIQSIFPPAAKAIREAMDAMNEKRDGWEKQVQGAKAYASTLFLTGKIGQDAYLSIAKSFSPVTAAQEKQIALNKKAGEVAAKFQDAQVAAMKALQGPLTWVLDKVTGLLGLFEKLPASILLAAAAMKMFGASMANAGGLGAMLRGAGMGGAGAGGGAGGGLINLSGAGASVGRFAGIGRGASAVGKMVGGKALPLLGLGFAATAGYDTAKTNSIEAGETEQQATSKARKGAIASVAGSGIGMALGSIAGPMGIIVGGILGEKFLSPILTKALGAETQKVNKIQKEEIDPMTEQVIKMKEMLTTSEYLVDVNGKLKAAYQEQVEIMKEAGQLGGLPEAIEKSLNATIQLTASNKKMVQTLTSGNFLDSISQAFEAVGSKLPESVIDAFAKQDYSTAFATLQAALTEATTLKKLSLEGDFAKQKDKEGPEALKIKKELEDITNKEAIATTLVGKAQQANTAYLRGQIDVAKEIGNSYNAQADKLSQLNDVYSKRLDLERSVQEAAQFGMGASISMMQKQISMAYTMMGIEKNRLALMDQKTVAGLKQVGIDEQSSAAAIEGLKNAKDSATANAIIERYSNGSADATKVLTDYSQKYQESNGKILEQQKKVYDLTKDIREGYLDAVREMTAGAGEFESIIGTQDMGVTQLMDKVDMFTPGALNTMRTGGIQSKENTAAGVGMGITGAYSAGGPTLSFIGQDEQNSRNKRIYGYEESEKQAKAMSRGEGRQATAGSALALGEDAKYFRPIQEEVNIIADGTKKAFKDLGMNRLPGTITGGAGTGGTFGNYERNNTSLAFPTSVAFGARASSPADPSGFVRGAMSGKMGGTNNQFTGGKWDQLEKANDTLFKLDVSFLKLNKSFHSGTMAASEYKDAVSKNNNAYKDAKKTHDGLIDEIGPSAMAARKQYAMSSMGLGQIDSSNVPQTAFNTKWGIPTRLTNESGISSQSSNLGRVSSEKNKQTLEALHEKTQGISGTNDISSNSPLVGRLGAMGVRGATMGGIALADKSLPNRSINLQNMRGINSGIESMAVDVEGGRMAVLNDYLKNSQGKNIIQQGLYENGNVTKSSLKLLKPTELPTMNKTTGRYFGSVENASQIVSRTHGGNVGSIGKAAQTIQASTKRGIVTGKGMGGVGAIVGMAAQLADNFAGEAMANDSSKFVRGAGKAIHQTRNVADVVFGGYGAGGDLMSAAGVDNPYIQGAASIGGGLGIMAAGVHGMTFSASYGAGKKAYEKSASVRKTVDPVADWMIGMTSDGKAASKGENKILEMEKELKRRRGGLSESEHRKKLLDRKKEEEESISEKKKNAAIANGDSFENGEIVSKEEYIQGNRISTIKPNEKGELEYTTDDGRSFSQAEYEATQSEGRKYEVALKKTSQSGKIASSQNGSAETPNILGEFNSKEMGSFASGLSQSLGSIKQRKTESDSEFTARRTKSLSQQYTQSKPWENFARNKDETDEDYEKRTTAEQKKQAQTRAAIKMAGGMRYDKKGLDKETGKEVVMETMGGKGYTSEAARKGIEGPTGDNSVWQQIEGEGGIGGGGGFGGGAGGVITVELSSELKGTINEMHGILLKINDAASTKG